MQRAWLYTIVAALGLAATSTRPAAAAGMFGSVDAKSSRAPATSWTDSMKFWKSDPAPVSMTPVSNPELPSSKISPWRHPFSYMSATISETPIAQSIGGHKSEAKVVSSHDGISLDTPTGPTTPQFYTAMAQLAERQGNIAEARRQMQQALTKWPNDAELLRTAARMEDRQGQLQLAELLYQRAVKINPQNPAVLNDLGLCLARQGKFTESVQCMEQAIQLQPEKALYRNNVATVLVEMHEDQRALAHLSAVHGAAASNYNLGQLLADRGRPHEAVMYFQTALDMDPTLEPARQAIVQLHGTVSTPEQVVVEGPIVPQQEVAPAYDDRFTPQQPVTEPSIPATARGPAFGTSTYVVPAQGQPTAGVARTYQQSPVYQTATAPRYLPPVNPSTHGSVSVGGMTR